MNKDYFNNDEVGEPSAKKMVTEWSNNYSDKAMLIMKKMGFENDKGLGKSSQGRLEPVIAFQQDGRKGLGLSRKTEESQDRFWSESEEIYDLPEKVSWLQNYSNSNFLFEDLKKNINFGIKKLSLEGETTFCSEEILNEVLSAKSVLDDLNENDLRKARSRSNPFETIRSSIFLNRAAVKMANIDSMLDFMLTNPLDIHGKKLVGPNELLFFADICAGPGGFSEYILYRKSWESKGFGFTLRGQNDFKLDKFCAGPAECFDPYYGIFDDGDIYKEENQDSFTEYVKKHCSEGVHFVMADGGFSVEGQENIQEILSKQLYLCQFVTALKVLRNQGHFVCKIFDIFTPFSVGLIYMMYKCFNKISIIKPNSSRPANSERYLICKNKNEDTTEACLYLNYINRIMNSNKDQDILEIVLLDDIINDNNFFQYIRESNEEFAKNQILGLRKIATYCKYPNLRDKRQIDFRNKCLHLWNLPDTIRQPPDVKPTDKFLEEVLGEWWDNKMFLSHSGKEIQTNADLEKHIDSILDWSFIPIGRGETNLNSCSLFLCKSKGTLLRYTDNKSWEAIEHIFDIIPKSLFYGEIVYEYCGEGRTLSKVSALHIIDAVMLGGKDIKRHDLSSRLSYCHKFASSINKPHKENKNAFVRSKPLYNMKDIGNFFEEMKLYTLKDNSKRLGIDLRNSRYFVPGGLLFLPEMLVDYMKCISKTTKQIYCFNKRTRESFYIDQQQRDDSIASFRNAFCRRLVWKWVKPEQVEKQKNTENEILCRYDIENYVAKQIVL